MSCRGSKKCLQSYNLQYGIFILATRHIETYPFAAYGINVTMWNDTIRHSWATGLAPDLFFVWFSWMIEKQRPVQRISMHYLNFDWSCLGPVSISEKTSFRKISSSLEAARFVFRIVRSLWNLTGTSAAVLPMCLSNFKTIRQFKVQISWLRDFTRSYEKTSFRILRRGPGSVFSKKLSCLLIQ